MNARGSGGGFLLWVALAVFLWGMFKAAQETEGNVFVKAGAFLSMLALFAGVPIAAGFLAYWVIGAWFNSDAAGLAALMAIGLTYGTISRKVSGKDSN